MVKRLCALIEGDETYGFAERVLAEAMADNSPGAALWVYEPLSLSSVHSAVLMLNGQRWWFSKIRIRTGQGKGGLAAPPGEDPGLVAQR